jgi:tetratricopeptide (TPR) repeat protein
MKRYVFFSIFLMLFFASCETVRYSSTKIQTLAPPSRVIILPNTANIAIVASLDERADEMTQSTDSLVATNIAMSIKNYLETSPKYSSYIFPVYTVNAEENGLTDEQIADIKASSDANYLISVEYFKSTINRRQIRNTRDNCVLIIGEYNSKIKIYDVDKLTVLDERLIIDTLTIQVNMSPWETASEFMQRVPSDKASLLLISKAMAKSYAEEIAPSWKEESRFYYIESHIERAQMYIENEEWAKAMNVWSKYVNDENRTLAAVSCFNMALGCEMLGEYELAMKWMESVKRKNEDYYWDEYINLIEKRISEKKVIDRAME